MTHPALQHLSIDEIRRLGADARQMGLPFHSNPFYRSDGSDDVELGAWLAKASAWSDGWVQKDAGRDDALQRQMLVRFW